MHFLVLVGVFSMGCWIKNEEVCQVFRKRIIDVCLLQAVRWKGQPYWVLVMDRRRFKIFVFRKCR